MTTMAKRRLWTFAAVGLAVLSATFVATPANAKPGKPGTGGRNCVIELATGSRKPVSTSCFDGFNEAVGFATQGRVTDASALAAPSAGLDRSIQESNQAAAVSPNAFFVLSIEYFDTAGIGPALVYIGATQCTASVADVDYELILASVDYDQISSFYTSYCWVNHYFLQNFNSANTGYHPCGTTHCAIPLMQPGSINGDNNTRALRWT